MLIIIIIIILFHKIESNSSTNTNLFTVKFHRSIVLINHGERQRQQECRQSKTNCLRQLEDKLIHHCHLRSSLQHLLGKQLDCKCLKEEEMVLFNSSFYNTLRITIFYHYVLKCHVIQKSDW